MLPLHSDFLLRKSHSYRVDGAFTLLGLEKFWSAASMEAEGLAVDERTAKHALRPT